MEIIEENIKLLLQGGAVEEPQEYCDFTLEEQNEANGLLIEKIIQVL